MKYCLPLVRRCTEQKCHHREYPGLYSKDFHQSLQLWAKLALASRTCHHEDTPHYRCPQSDHCQNKHIRQSAKLIIKSHSWVIFTYQLCQNNNIGKKIETITILFIYIRQCYCAFLCLYWIQPTLIKKIKSTNSPSPPTTQQSKTHKVK